MLAIAPSVMTANQDDRQRPAPQPAPPTTPTATPAPTPQADKAPVRRPRGKDVNVQIDVIITDQTGAGPAGKKTVSLLAADQTMGRVRASADANKANLGRVATTLNVDASPTILENDRILLQLTLEYRPLLESQVAEAQHPTNLNESLSIILTNGKPLTISQAADPITDRRMTVEVKATILK
jgi:hypothetical protein